MAKFMDKAMNEVIVYGGLPMTRANVHRVAIEDLGGNAKGADFIAFGPNYKVAPPGVVGMSIEEFRFVGAKNRLPKGWTLDLDSGLPQPSSRNLTPLKQPHRKPERLPPNRVRVVIRGEKGSQCITCGAYGPCHHDPDFKQSCDSAMAAYQSNKDWEAAHPEGAAMRGRLRRGLPASKQAPRLSRQEVA